MSEDIIPPIKLKMKFCQALEDRGDFDPPREPDDPTDFL
jgi:hypothetical protein